MISYAWMIILVLSYLCCAKPLYCSGFLTLYTSYLCAVLFSCGMYGAFLAVLYSVPVSKGHCVYFVMGMQMGTHSESVSSPI